MKLIGSKLLLFLLIVIIKERKFNVTDGNYNEKSNNPPLKQSMFADQNKSEEIRSTLTNRRNNWAIIVDTSRYYYNYRHTSNALTFYRTLRKMGMPDSHIILMLADDAACDPRNPSVGSIFNNINRGVDLYVAQSIKMKTVKRNVVQKSSLLGNKYSSCYSRGMSSSTTIQIEGVDIDYKGNDVSVNNFIRLLTGRHGKGGFGGSDSDKLGIVFEKDIGRRNIGNVEGRSRRLLSNADSNILIFLTGHGGNGFLKFQDWEEITNVELADAVEQMHRQKRYKRLFFVADTCQAATLFSFIRSPNVIALPCSKEEENSYSHHTDPALGVAVIDRFTYHSQRFFDRIFMNEMSKYKQLNNCVVISNSTMPTIEDYLKFILEQETLSTPSLIYSFSSDGSAGLRKIPLADFFSPCYISHLESIPFKIEKNNVNSYLSFDKFIQFPNKGNNVSHLYYYQSFYSYYYYYKKYWQKRQFQLSTQESFISWVSIIIYRIIDMLYYPQNALYTLIAGVSLSSITLLVLI